MIDRLLNLPTPVRAALFGLVAAAVLTLGWLTLQPSDNTDAKTPDSSSSTGPTANPTVAATTTGSDAAPQENPYVGDYTKDTDLQLAMPVSDGDLKIVANRAAQFAQLFLSYKYNQDDNDKRTEMNRLLAEDNTIDLVKVFPSGSLLNQYQKNETTVAVKIDKIEATLVSKAAIGLTITATSTTSTVSDNPRSSQDAYSMTLSYDPGRGAWYVTSFTTQGTDSAFQDESLSN